MCYKKIIQLIVLLAISVAARAEICVNVDVPTRKLMLGRNYTATIQVSNVPAGGKLKVLVNGDQMQVEAGTAVVYFDKPVIGYHAVEIAIIVMGAGGPIYNENKHEEFIVYDAGAAFEIQGQDYLYRGLTTEIKLMANGIVNSDLVINIGAGINLRKKNESCVYSAIVDNKIANSKLQLVAKVEDGSVAKVANKAYRIVDLPEPVCRLTKALDSISIKDTCLNMMVVVPNDLLGRVSPMITSYECRIWSNNEWYACKINGATVSGELLNKMKAMKQGDMVCFTAVNVKWTNDDEGPKGHTSFIYTK